MSEFLRRLVLEHRPILIGLGALVLAALDLTDPALLTGVGVILVTLASEAEA